MSGNNHSFIQHESKGTSEEEIQDKVMKRPTIQQAIPYQYANNPIFIKICYTCNSIIN